MGRHVFTAILPGVHLQPYESTISRQTVCQLFRKLSKCIVHCQETQLNGVLGTGGACTTLAYLVPIPFDSSVGRAEDCSVRITGMCSHL